MFAVDFSISLKSLPLQSVHDPVTLAATSSVSPVTLSWDFGDLSSRVNATGAGLTTAAHKYGLPGHYAVSVLAWAGHKEVTFDSLQHFQNTTSFSSIFNVFCRRVFSMAEYLALIFTNFQVSARGEVTVTVPPKLELRCPTLAVANKSLEFTLVSWGAVGVDVDWKITKDGVQVAKGKTQHHRTSQQLMTLG